MRYLSATAILLVSTLSQTDAQFIETTILPVTATGYAPEIPAQRRSMGHLSIGLPDALADPFINPAEIVRGAKDLIFISPALSSWTFQEQSATQLYRGIQIMTKNFSVGATSADAGIVRHNDTMGIAFMAGWHHNSNALRETYQHPRFGEWTEDTTSGGEYVPLAIGWGGWIPGTGIAVGASIAWTFIDGTALPPFFQENSAVSQTGYRYEARVGASAPFEQGVTKMIAGYTATSLGEGLYTDRRHTWFAQLDHRLSISERLDLGARALVNLSQRNEDFLFRRIPSVAAGFNIGTGAAWHAPWGTLAAEYIIEPLSSATTLDSAGLEVGPDEQLTARTWHPFAEREDDIMNHIIRAGMEIPVSGITVVRLGSQARINRYNCHCSDGEENVAVPEMPVRWTEISLTGGVEIALGTARLLADGELTSGRGLPIPPPSTSGSLHPVPSCPIPPSITGSRREAPLLTARITFLWQPDF